MKPNRAGFDSQGRHRMSSRFHTWGPMGELEVATRLAMLCVSEFEGRTAGLNCTKPRTRNAARVRWYDAILPRLKAQFDSG